VDSTTAFVTIAAAAIGIVGVYFQYTRPAKLQIERDERVKKEELAKSVELKKFEAVAASHDDIKDSFRCVSDKVGRLEDHQKKLAAIMAASMSERLVYLLDLYLEKGTCTNYQYKQLEIMYKEYSDENGLIKGNGLVQAKWVRLNEAVEIVD